MTRRRLLGIAIVISALAGAILFGLLGRAVVVDLQEVSEGPLRVLIEEEGRTRVKDRFVISAPVDAADRRIELEVGDPVTAGQSLVVLEPRLSTPLDPRSRAVARERVDVAEAARVAADETAKAAVAEAEHAGIQLARIRDVFATGSASREELDEAAAEARRTAARKRSAEFAARVALHELHEARAALDYLLAEHRGEDVPDLLPLRAPAAGRVLAIHGESAGPVRAGDPLLEIGDPKALEVAVDVLSLHAVRLEPGLRVLFERWGGDPLEGTVRTIEPTGFTKTSALGVEEQRVWVICDITSPPERWTRLGDGYRVEARFVLWEAERVLRVPESALFRHRDRWAVFAVEGDRAVLRTVELGRRNGVLAQVLSGLAPGARVVTHPPRELEDGDRVTPRS